MSTAAPASTTIPEPQRPGRLLPTEFAEHLPLEVFAMAYTNGVTRQRQPAHDPGHGPAPLGGHEHRTGIRHGTRDLTDAEVQWRVFLLAWRGIHGGRAVTANELCRSAAGRDAARWAGSFPQTSRGELPSAKSLGRILAARVDRLVGGVVLRSVPDAHTKSRVYWVEHARQPRQLNRLAGTGSTWVGGPPAHGPAASAVNAVAVVHGTGPDCSRTGVVNAPGAGVR